MTPTLEEYEKARTIIENYYLCDRCKKLLRRDTSVKTVYYGSTKFWCPPCYEKVKGG